MTFDFLSQSNIVSYLVSGGVAGIVYLVLSYFRGNLQASEAATDVYESLNTALEKKVATLEKDLKDAFGRIEEMEVSITKLTADLANYETLIVRSLREHWESHPSEARALRKAKQMT